MSPTRVIKLSGEAFAGHSPLNGLAFEAAAEQLLHLAQDGFALGVVVGGGNIMRGNRQWGSRGMPSEHLHQLGMQATVMNAIALAFQLQRFGVNTELIARPSLGIPQAKPWTTSLDRPADGTVYVVAGGTGSTGVSTDVAAVELARDLCSDSVIVSKFGVNGIYSGDPNRPTADAEPPVLLHKVTTELVLERNLAFMDKTAVELCQRWNIIVRVVGAGTPSDMYRAAIGERIGSIMLPTGYQGPLPDMGDRPGVRSELEGGNLQWRVAPAIG